MQRDRHAGLAGHVEELCERHELDQRLPIGVEIRIVRAQRPHRNRRLRKGRAEEEIVGLMERGHQPALPMDALQRGGIGLDVERRREGDRVPGDRIDNVWLQLAAELFGRRTASETLLATSTQSA